MPRRVMYLKKLRRKSLLQPSSRKSLSGSTCIRAVSGRVKISGAPRFKLLFLMLASCRDGTATLANSYSNLLLSS